MIWRNRSGVRVWSGLVSMKCTGRTWWRRRSETNLPIPWTQVWWSDPHILSWTNRNRALLCPHPLIHFSNYKYQRTEPHDSAWGFSYPWLHTGPERCRLALYPVERPIFNMCPVRSPRETTAIYEGLGWANFNYPRRSIFPSQYLKLSHWYISICIVEYFSEEFLAIGKLWNEGKQNQFENLLSVCFLTFGLWRSRVGNQWSGKPPAPKRAGNLRMWRVISKCGSEENGW